MSLAGGALVWGLVVALAFAPAIAAPGPGAATPPASESGALDLSARWPLLLDASTRVLAPHGGERALPRAQRRTVAAQRVRRARAAHDQGPVPRPPSLSALGRRQRDGG